ncbi:hypothetical protein [Dyadobacter sp. Leaf189]|uniref:hypothetical protein n=1 Tax=Dyadobacter sp. Leaf189 TaxID=1736295 RepID=UPI0006F42F7F|nr:hypothetical protein [Dyadobacter sp. Leaf189]KQS34176.1 hypothetical protein ASG33_09200 [Dyadobacter sp. Leaf189]
MRKTLVAYLMLGLAFTAFAAAQIERSVFYNSLSSGDESTIDRMIAGLESEKPTSRNKAYIAALTMKKAGFVKGAGEKLKVFKKGAQILEEEIKSQPDNAEYRFLRLTIQEHAPKILKYNKQVDEDKRAVVAAYSKLHPSVQSAVADYAKNSKVLSPSDLK